LDFPWRDTWDLRSPSPRGEEAVSLVQTVQFDAVLLNINSYGRNAGGS
jgi:hypothetical protein